MTRSYLFALVRNDLAVILRDRSLWAMMLLAPAFFLLVRYGLPNLSLLIDFTGYEAHIVAFCAMTTVMFPAYVLSFVMLDEKDQDVLSVMRTMPVGAHVFLGYRTVFVIVLSWVCAFPVFLLNTYVPYSLTKAIGLSFLTSLTAPVLLFMVFGFAKNKIEGVTWLKLANLIIVLPFLFFFMEGPVAWTLSIVPVFWTYLSAVTKEAGQFYLYGFFGLCAHGVSIYFLFRRAIKNL